MYVNSKHEDYKVGCLRVSFGHQGKSSYGCMEIYLKDVRLELAKLLYQFMFFMGL